MPEIVPGLGEIVEDRLLDGRLILRQPRKGHRAGTDAILLAAALPNLGEGPLADLSAGVGSVGLLAAIAQPEPAVCLVERDPELAALAAANAALNALASRVRVVVVDIAAPARVLERAGLVPASFACVAMNPPFFAPHEGRRSPIPNRSAAHVADEPLAIWFKAARRLLRPGGTLALIHRAEALGEVLKGLQTGFGGIMIRPVQASAESAAIRVVVTAVLNSKKPAALLPALVLNGPDGRFTAQADAIHRGQERLMSA